MKSNYSPGSESRKKAPNVFISYTHESASHKEWVRKLAHDLRRNGVDAMLDRWECKFGAELNRFMENGIERADRVLLVCTPSYKKKASSRKGGVAYERLVVTSEIAKNIDTEKFVCVLRAGTDATSIPLFCRSRLYINFREDKEYAMRLEDLLRDIHGAPGSPKPELGPNPFKPKTSPIKATPKLTGKAAIGKPPLGSNPFNESPKLANDLKPDDSSEVQTPAPVRRRMLETRTAVNHKFDIAGHEGFITIGLFETGEPGELQIRMAKESSTIGGLLDTVAILTSVALQYGVPLEALVRKFAHMRFEPAGFTKNPELRNATSIVDYIFRWMALQFIPGYREALNPKSGISAIPGLLEDIKSVSRLSPSRSSSPVEGIKHIKYSRQSGLYRCKLIIRFPNRNDHKRIQQFAITIQSMDLRTQIVNSYDNHSFLVIAASTQPIDGNKVTELARICTGEVTHLSLIPPGEAIDLS